MSMGQSGWGSSLTEVPSFRVFQAYEQTIIAVVWNILYQMLVPPTPAHAPVSICLVGSFHLTYVC